MRISLSVFGFEVFALDIQTWQIEECDEEDEEDEGWGGHSAVATHIESPMVRYDPDDRYRWDEEYRRRAGVFGFR